METTKNKIKKEELTTMEELLHQSEYRISDLEAICEANILGTEVEFEVYPLGESYPSYFLIPIDVFSEYLNEWYDKEDIYKCVTSEWIGKELAEDLKAQGALLWYEELGSDKDKIEATNYVINRLFTDIF